MVTPTRQRPAMRKPPSGTINSAIPSTNALASNPSIKASSIEARHLNTIWVDRTERELRCQLQWQNKWGILNDAKLYGGENAPDRYSIKQKPTKWAAGAYSVINSPRHNPAVASHHSSTNNSRPSSGRANMRNDQISMKDKTRTTILPKQNQASLASYRFSTTSDQHTQNQISTPHGPSLSFRSSLHPLKHTRLHDHPPMEAYHFPATTSQSYGWAWNGRSTLEIYGSTSCNYRALAGQKTTGATG